MVRILDLAKMLAERDGIDQKQAAEFVDGFFEQIVQSLPTERLVKINGLGTFKIQQVKARESVSVNSGERLLIQSHDRISFVPDKTLRDAVNKPFAAFQTVEINDGVDFSAINAAMTTPNRDDLDEAEPVEESEVPSPNDINTETDKQAKEETEEFPLKTEEPKQEFAEQIEPFEIKDAPKTEVNKTEIADEMGENQTSERTEQDYDNSVTKEYLEDRLGETKSRFRCWIVGATLVILVVGIAGFFLGRQIAINSERSATSQQAIISSLRAELSRVKNELSLKTTTEADTTVRQKQTVNRKVNVPLTAKSKETKAVKTEKIVSNVRYGEDDPEVRHGAYIILGIEKTVKVRQGQTLSSISKANYGPGMECYVRAVNPGVSTLKAGQKINLPKLKLKRIKR